MPQTCEQNLPSSRSAVQWNSIMKWRSCREWAEDSRGTPASDAGARDSRLQTLATRTHHSCARTLRGPRTAARHEPASSDHIITSSSSAGVLHSCSRTTRTLKSFGGFPQGNAIKGMPFLQGCTLLHLVKKQKTSFYGTLGLGVTWSASSGSIRVLMRIRALS